MIERIYNFDWLKDIWMQEQKIEKVKQLVTIAQKINVSLPALSIAWTLHNPNVTTAILGATKKEQLLENLQALEALPLLTPSIMDEIEAILQNKPVKPSL